MRTAVQDTMRRLLVDVKCLALFSTFYDTNQSHFLTLDPVWANNTLASLGCGSQLYTEFMRATRSTQSLYAVYDSLPFDQFEGSVDVAVTIEAYPVTPSVRIFVEEETKRRKNANNMYLSMMDTSNSLATMKLLIRLVKQNLQTVDHLEKLLGGKLTMRNTVITAQSNTGAQALQLVKRPRYTDHSADIARIHVHDQAQQVAEQVVRRSLSIDLTDSMIELIHGELELQEHARLMETLLVDMHKNGGVRPSQRMDIGAQIVWKVTGDIIITDTTLTADADIRVQVANASHIASMVGEATGSAILEKGMIGRSGYEEIRSALLNTDPYLKKKVNTDPYLNKVTNPEEVTMPRNWYDTKDIPRIHSIILMLTCIVAIMLAAAVIRVSKSTRKG